MILEDPIPTHTALPDERHEERARDMGRRRRQHDDRADARAAADANAETDRRALCLQRWPGILAAIRAQLAAYNDGAGEELVTASEGRDGDDPVVTIASRSSAHAGIIISVDGDALLVRTNPEAAAGFHGIARRIDCSRSDTATAAYLLQDWMDRL